MKQTILLVMQKVFFFSSLFERTNISW